jgi:hypothetical protein
MPDLHELENELPAYPPVAAFPEPYVPEVDDQLERRGPGLRPFSLRDRNGRILFTDDNAQSMGDTMASYVDHLDHITTTNRNLNVHREVLRELGEVMHTHRGDFALANGAVELDARVAGFPPPPFPGGLRGLVARVRATPQERALERQRQSVLAQRNVLAATMPDAEQMVEAGQALEEMRSALYRQALMLRSRDISKQLAREPEWLTNTLGPRPDDPELQTVWDRTAQEIAGRRIDLQITEPDSHGLPANQHELLGSTATARVELGLDVAPTPTADRELGLSRSSRPSLSTSLTATTMPPPPPHRSPNERAPLSARACPRLARRPL